MPFRFFFFNYKISTFGWLTALLCIIINSYQANLFDWLEVEENSSYRLNVTERLDVVTCQFVNSDFVVKIRQARREHYVLQWPQTATVTNSAATVAM